MRPQKPLVLCILDGLGYSKDEEFNAVKKAKTPVLDDLLKRYPNTLLQASGMSVGLPEGQIGNSEVGHMTIGLGRVVFQDLPTISMAIKNDTLKNVDELKSLINDLKSNGCRCHLWGLFSDGGVHSHIEHLFGLLNIMLSNDIKTFVHALLDGRDTAPKSAIPHFEEFDKKFGNKIQIATVCGRYYAMDRDKRWERTEAAYNMMIRPIKMCSSPKDYIASCYDNNLTDEFIPPIAIDGYDGIQEGDAFIVFNFRADRVRQMISALTDKNFSHFPRLDGMPKFSKILGVTEYAKEYTGKVGVMFKRSEQKNSLGEVISNAGLTQLRAAETEKYPHVTFFFNGGQEAPLDGEDRILVESPKVATYDLQPQMSALKLTEIVLDCIKNDTKDVYVINFANPDMVGHSGNLDTTIEAIECIDNCLGDIFKVVQSKNGHLIVTADHGNAEEMFDKVKNQPHTAHTANDVPFILASNDYANVNLAYHGGLKDIAPTILDILNLDKPSDISGESLILR